MPSALPTSSLPIRARPVIPQVQISDDSVQPRRHNKHRPCTSYERLSPLSQSFFAVQEPSQRASKRLMPTPSTTIAVINSSGRQAASFIRVASAVGYHVRAQVRNLDGIVATEISELPSVEVLVGELYTKSSPSASPKPETGVNRDLINTLFRGAQVAFINTTFWGDEVAIGKALADAAVEAEIQHYIYSSMPNHALHDTTWPSLPLWSSKFTTESYIRTLPTLLPKTTFLYTGIYNNNFTSLPYPLFCMELQSDGSFVWRAPFHPDVPLPWLDAEHDVGPAVLQIIKDGVSRWGRGERIALAYEMLSPREACRLFAKGVGRRVKYRRKPEIEVKVTIPSGYKEQLVALERMYDLSAESPSKQPPYFGTKEFEDSCPREAMELWEGPRGLEEYAREVFPLEEAANGLTWMNDDIGEDVGRETASVDEEEDEDEQGIVMGGGLASGAGSAGDTPARKEETWLA